MSSEFEPRIFDDTRKLNKINLRSKSKCRKTPVNRQNDSKAGADSSFHHKTSLTLSQMFNYYANHPINEKQCRKYRKNMQNAYRSYTSNNTSSKGNKKRFTSTNHWNLSKKDKQLAKILDIPLKKYSHMFSAKLHSKSKAKRDRKHLKNYRLWTKFCNLDVTSDILKQKDSRSYSRTDWIDSYTR